MGRKATPAQFGRFASPYNPSDALGGLFEGPKNAKFARLGPCHKGCEGKEGECASAIQTKFALFAHVKKVE